jgi:3'(2'), 5'-bisphosphate nucleotidase
MPFPQRHDELTLAVGAALGAGQAILEVYRTAFRVEHKADDSPLTEADRRAHTFIKGHLASSGLPLLSEEGRAIPFAERCSWARFWLVDPLDGTKEFVRRNGEFTVNIALVEDRRPLLGVLYVPVADRLYVAAPGIGARLLADARASFTPEDPDWLARARPLPRPPETPRPYTIVGSRRHGAPRLEAFVDAARARHGRVEVISAGSALKFGLVAEGLADVYPRTGPTMEWDTAAGQAIVEAAGCRVVHFDTGAPLEYNKEDLLNPWFLVERKAGF